MLFNISAAIWEILQQFIEICENFNPSPENFVLHPGETIPSEPNNNNNDVNKMLVTAVYWAKHDEALIHLQAAAHYTNNENNGK